MNRLTLEDLRADDAMICVADFSISDGAFEYFKAEARKRKCSVAELARRLMNTIATDTMVDAIMDDAPEVLALPSPSKQKMLSLTKPSSVP